MLKLLSGSSNEALAKGISEHLDVELSEVTRKKFADGEWNLHVNKNVRGANTFILQSGSSSKTSSVNDYIMELYLLLQTLKLSAVGEITVVIPYFPYCRQDRKTKARTPISAAAMAQLLETMEPDHILTLDLHCGQIQGFFKRTPVDNLYSVNLFVNYLKQHNYHTHENLVIVSPDAGGVDRATKVADEMGGFPVITILKRRVEDNKVDKMDILGDVEDKKCVIIDDIVDTGGTLCKAIDLLKEKGAVSVDACITHGILSDPAMDRLNKNTTLGKLIITNSLPQNEHKATCSKIHVLDIAPLLGEAIRRIHNKESLSELFDRTKSG